MLRILEPCLRLDLTLRAYCTTILVGGIAQVTSLLFDMGQIKKVSLKPGFEDCH